MQMAEAMLKDNENYLGTDIMQESIEKIKTPKKSKATKEEGGEENGKKVSKSTRGRKATKAVR